MRPDYQGNSRSLQGGSSLPLSASQAVLRQVLKHLTSMNLISVYSQQTGKGQAATLSSSYQPGSGPPLPPPEGRCDLSAQSHLRPACQLNLTRLRERFDLIKPVAVSLLLRGPSVSPRRLRLDSDNYFFFPGCCLPLPLRPWREQGGRPGSWDLRIDWRGSKERSRLWPETAPLPYAALFQAEQQPEE